jgi:hypothetical protein
MEPEAPARPRGTRAILWAGAVCLLVILVVGGYDVLASNVLHGPVNGRSLYLSVKHAAEAENAITEDAKWRCNPAEEAREWTCEVDDRSGSGGGEYHVWVDRGSSCWRARLVLSGEGLPRLARGCVHLRESD